MRFGPFRTTQGILVQEQGEVYRNYCNVCGVIGGRAWKNPGDAAGANHNHRRYSKKCRPGQTPQSEWLGMES